MLGFYNYTVVLTYVGLLSGFTGITFAMRGNIRAALICLMLAGVCDMFDGMVAHTRKTTPQERRFGIQIDSLSDLICFGALPAITVYTATDKSIFAFITGAVYLLCALIRLAWFNVDEEERQLTCEGCRESYLGLPVTTTALIVPAFMGLGLLFRWPLYIPAPILLLLIAAAFITPFRLKKPAIAGKIGMLLCGGAELAVILSGIDL